MAALSGGRLSNERFLWELIFISEFRIEIIYDLVS
jgi:hypothetical protein